MNNEPEEQTAYSAWIDRCNRIVSFQEAEGFERVEFATHDEMFSFMIERSGSGYRIQ